MSSAVPYSVPEESGTLKAVLLAIAVHAALLAFLWFGVHWQSEVPVAFEAEVWSITPNEAAPPPAPAPVPKAAVEETPKQVQPKDTKPDIALEQEKKRKEQEQVQRQLEEEKKKADEAARKKQEQKEEALREKARQETMRRMMAQADIGRGDVAKSQGPGDPDYANLIKAKIRSNTNFPPSPDSNPDVEYELYLLPDGMLRQVKLLKPSGMPRFDDAVRTAIEVSQPYPADKSGRVPREVIVDYRLKDE